MKAGRGGEGVRCIPSRGKLGQPGGVWLDEKAGRFCMAGGGCCVWSRVAGEELGKVGTCEIEKGLAYHPEEFEHHSTGNGKQLDVTF